MEPDDQGQHPVLGRFDAADVPQQCRGHGGQGVAVWSVWVGRGRGGRVG
jgi:hypothetical protein